MAELEALIFDVDGTLADTERDGHRVAFNRAFEEAGLDWQWSVALYGKLLAVTGGKERIRHYLDHYNQDYPRQDDLDGFIAALHASKTQHYTRMLSQGLIPMRSGVKRLLHEARQAGLRLAIATTTTPANVSALLQHSLDPDAESWFEVIAAGDIVAAKNRHLTSISGRCSAWVCRRVPVSPSKTPTMGCNPPAMPPSTRFW